MADKKKKPYIPLPPTTGLLGCSKTYCQQKWFVQNLNTEVKVVKCPSCGSPVSITEALKNAA